MKQKVKIQRRAPKQGRAMATRDAIFEAATQILEGEGEVSFTTNHIAERAGVSIGTLYQYFSNKEEILMEIAQREHSAVEKYGEECTGKTDEHLHSIRQSVRSLIQAFRDKPATRRAAVRAIISAELSNVFAVSTDRGAELFPIQNDVTELDNYILSRAVMGVVRAAVVENNEGLYKPEFEDSLVRLVEGFLSQQATN